MPMTVRGLPTMHGDTAGPALLLVGAFLFSLANILAKTIYTRGTSQTALFVVRAIVVYAMNVCLEAFRNGRASAVRVGSLRVGNRRLVGLCLLRSSAGWVGITLLNVAFMVMTIADAFALVLGTMTISTVVGARACCGGSERLTRRAMAGGLIAIAGLLLVTQPEAIFGGSAPPLAGVLLCLWSGAVLGTFNILTRVLGRAKSGASGNVYASPGMLLSYYMVTVGVGSGAVALIAQAIHRVDASATEPAASATNMDDSVADVSSTELGGQMANGTASSAHGAWDWTQFRLPSAAVTWAVTAGYCVCILAGQIVLAMGYARLPAGRAAVIALTEIGFAWLLDVTVLREPTNALAACGTFTVFVGCALAAMGATSTPPPAGSASEIDGGGADGGGGPPPARLARESLASADAASTFAAADWVEVVTPAPSVTVKADEA